MRTPRAAAAAWPLLLALAGCDPGPRTVVSAKPIETAPTQKPAEAPAAPERSDPAALELVTAALSAHTEGQPSRLQKFRNVRFVRAGSGRSFTQEMVFQTWTIEGQWPDRWLARAEFPGQTVAEVALNGDAGWKRARVGQANFPPAAPFTKQETETTQADITGEWLWLGFPLLDPAAVVAPTADATIAGRPAKGVRVWHPKLAAATVHFDPETKLIARVGFEGREGGSRAAKEFNVVENRPYEGVKLAHRLEQKLDGQKYADWTLTALESKPPFEAKHFAQP